MRKAYMIVAHLISLGVVLQAAWIALAYFLLDSRVEDGKNVPKGYSNIGNDLHGVFGNAVIPLLAVVLLVLAFLTPVPGARKWAAFVLVDVVVQIALAGIAGPAPVVGALHGINAFVLLGLAEFSARNVTKTIS